MMNATAWSPARLPRLHQVLAGHVARGAAPGLVALVSRRDDVHVEALGATAVAGRQPMRRDTIFRISSMTKPIAAAAAMILVEECVLRLDDPVDPFLPELANRRVLRTLQSPLDDTVPAQRPITLRDLLTFRLGLGMNFSPGEYPIQRAIDDLCLLGFGAPNPAAVHTPDEWLRRLGTLPLMAQPGERWLYNTGFSILGVLLARAAGQDLGTFLHERIFAPLGMRDTAFSVPAEKLDRLAAAYWTDFESGALQFSDNPAGSQWAQLPAFPDAAAGLVSTADDYLAFARMLLNNGSGGTARILARPSVALMTANQLTPAQVTASGMAPGSFGYGFGVSVQPRDDIGASAGAYGWDGGLGTSWANDPKEELIGVLLTQAAFAGPSQPAVVRDFWVSAYQAIAD